MKKICLCLLVLAILATVIWYGMKFFAKPSATQPEVIWVNAITVSESGISMETNAIGSLVARSVEITPDLAGHVQNIYFQDGTFVKKGTPLIQLDDEIYRTKLQSAKAQLTFSESTFNRLNQLVARGDIAKQTIEQANADLKDKKAMAEENSVMVNKMLLTAPFDGIVGKSKVNLGDYVTVAQSVVTLTDTKHLRIEYNVPEKYLSALKLGQTVKIKTSAYPGKTFIGTVAYISPTINIDNRSISLYAQINNDDNLLAPGMFVNVLHSLGREEKVLLIPARSLVPIFDGEQVYKIVDGKAYAISVVIGKRVNDNVEIIQGLAKNDVVITDGQLKVKNGTPVSIKSAAALKVSTSLS